MKKYRIVFRNIRVRLVALTMILVAAGAVRDHTSPTIDRYVLIVEIPPSLETEAGDRDIIQYDFGGHVLNCVQQDDEESCYKNRDQARNFIEQHFKSQRRGYLIIDGASNDLPSTAWFFVEPNSMGEWEVRVRIPIHGPYSPSRPNMNTIYYTEVFRRRVGNGELNIERGTSALILRSRTAYELAL